MNRCQRCGVPYHPDSLRCPLCRTLSRNEAQKRKKILFLTQTFAVSAVAVVVLMRVLTGAEIAVGMTQSDCQEVSQLRKVTALTLEGLSQGRPGAQSELSEISDQWGALASNYVPGKFSWSSSGPEHRWLEKLHEVTSAIASGSSINTEDQSLTAEDYAQQLLRLEYRFCN